MKLLLLFLLLCGCANSPPFSVSAGFMGADVTVATPGWSAPVPVVKSAVTTPVLLVPVTSPIASQSTAVASSYKGPVTVPVVVANVPNERLAVPF